MSPSDEPHLRFDKVVIRVSERLHVALRPVVPRGVTVVVTMTAPIRQAAKTAAALEARIRAQLERPARRRAARAVVHGNRIRIGFESRVPDGALPVVVFVHNPGTDPRVLLDMAHQWALWLRRLGRRNAGREITYRSHYQYSPGAMDAYQHLASTLGPPTAGQTLSIVFADGRREALEA